MVAWVALGGLIFAGSWWDIIGVFFLPVFALLGLVGFLFLFFLPCFNFSVPPLWMEG